MTRRSFKEIGAALALGAALGVPAATRPAAASAFDVVIGATRFQGPFLAAEGGDVALDDLYLQFEGGGPSSRFTMRLAGVKVQETGLVTFAADAPVILGAGGPGRPPWQESDAGDDATDLGDILLRTENYLSRSGQGNRPALSFILDYKYAEADEKKGLGTGENDWGGGLSYVQPLGKVLQILGDASYHFMGSPEGVDFNDRLRLMVGFGIVTRRTRWRLVAENVAPALDQVPFYDATGVQTGVVDVEDWRVARGEFVYLSKAGGSTRLMVLMGLNDSSPDLGFGLSFASRPQ